MKFEFDLSLNTLIISSVVAFVGYGLKGVAWALIEATKKLVTTLLETIAKVEILDAKMTELTQAVGDIQKMRSDINAYYDRLRSLEKKFDEPKHHS